MEVVFHAGAHCTDENQLVRSLQRNRATLNAAGVSVPGQGRYKPLLREALQGLRGSPASKEMQQTLLDAILEGEPPRRLILSSETFMGALTNALDGARLYPMAEEKARWMRGLFPDAQPVLALGIRNPATFLPAVAMRQGAQEGPRLIERSDPRALRWSDLVHRLRGAHPEVPIIVWCDEDTPLIWGEVMHAVAGLGPDQSLAAGRDDRLTGLMSAAGQVKLQDYLARTPPATDAQRRRIVTAFLDKFALDDEIELELDLPGWTHELVEAATEAYDADTGMIAAMDGVHFIAP